MGKLKNYVHLGVTVTPEMRDDITAEAARAGLPRTEFVRLGLAEWLRLLRRGEVRISTATRNDTEEAA